MGNLKSDMFKITTLQSFSYYEENKDKGAVIRDKSILICDLLTHPERLEDERIQAQQFRDKIYGPSKSAGGYAGYSGGYSAPGGNSSYNNQSSYNNYNEPNRYQGYGSEDTFPSQESQQQEVGSLGNLVRNVGSVATGIGGAVVGGIGYLAGARQQ